MRIKIALALMSAIFMFFLGRDLNRILSTSVDVYHTTFFRGLDRVIEYYFIFRFHAFLVGNKEVLPK